MPDLNSIIPKVLLKKGDGVISAPFDVQKIIDSILTETSATREEALAITKSAMRIILSGRKHITAPMIREIVCTVMLDINEKLRFEYTRIGFPREDLKKILLEEDFRDKIIDHILFEYGEVEKLITTFENEDGKN